MNKRILRKSLKGLLGLAIFLLVSVSYTGYAKANTSNTFADANTKISVEPGQENVDIHALMGLLEGKELENGDVYTLNSDYEAHVVVIMEKQSPSTDIRLMSTTNTYIATCYVYILHSGTNVHVATVTHTVNITYYDNGLVHINSGNISSTTLVSYINGVAYGYTITNTDGSYSYAYGMVQLYDIGTALYYYYGYSVTVYPNSSPSFNFQQV